ncbi:hypothetical protein J2X47_000068 [Sphingomonas sp. BE270]|jgi:hypothetical protein|uniref:hypothetical protein n=2 Tax=unclassified Sphingomonas TaxID=196159 RepID=UPI0010F72269|nr:MULTISPECIES: hypothetical protein [unclassified Sphingomonas]MDR6848625.1 hypothetical protein [Sphingomonas sp. BE137]MDR7255907.1 hypothetical protein [Sphingomonas sp. BE270]
MMLTGLLVYTIIVMQFFPETAVARWLDRTVAITRDVFGRIERRHLIFLMLTAVILIAGAELLAIAGPFDMALVVLWDVSTYIDIVLTTAVIATATRGGAGWRTLIARFLPRRAPRARRRRGVQATPPSANDDDRPAFARAA